MSTQYAFEHINLSEIDDSRKAVEQNVYTLEVNKVDYKLLEVKTPESPILGEKVPVLKASFTIVDDPTYSGRRLWADFFTANFKTGEISKRDVIGLKKLGAATGCTQGENETLEQWASNFATLSPPARLQVLVKKEVPYRDRSNPDAEPGNAIDFFTAKAV